MPRVSVTLADDAGGSHTFTDDDQGAAPFIDLSQYGWASRATQAIVESDEPAYVRGDHALLTEAAQSTSTDTIALDPDLYGGTVVPLASIDKGFSKRASGLRFVLNNAGPAYARASLYNDGDPLWQDPAHVGFPSLVVYNFQQQAGLVNLNFVYFANKAHHIKADFFPLPAGSNPQNIIDCNVQVWSDVVNPTTIKTIASGEWQDTTGWNSAALVFDAIAQLQEA